MKEKSPAFRFYPKDYQTDGKVRRLSWEARGLYVDLLCTYWLEGSLPDDVGALASIVGMSVKRFSKHWDLIRACFTSENGALKQKRMDLERQKQKDFSELQSEKGKKSAKANGINERTQPEPQPNANRTHVEPEINLPFPSSFPDTSTLTEIPPGRVVRAEPTDAEIARTKAFLGAPAGAGPPMNFAHEEKQTATASTKLTPQGIGFKYHPTQFAAQELAWTITRWLEARGAQTHAGRVKQALTLLGDASQTPKGVRITSLDLTRVMEAWTKVTCDRVIEIARDVYGFDATRGQA